jgi:hypothetical protein
MENVSDKICTKIQNTHFMFNNFFAKNRTVYKVEKYGTARQATDDITIWRMRFACWIKKAGGHTHKICNIYSFSTATMVARTRLNVTLYVQCVSCCVVLEGDSGIQSWKLHPQAYSAPITTCNDSSQNGPLQGAGRGEAIWASYPTYVSDTDSVFMYQFFTK